MVYVASGNTVHVHMEIEHANFSTKRFLNVTSRKGVKTLRNVVFYTLWGARPDSEASQGGWEPIIILQAGGEDGASKEENKQENQEGGEEKVKKKDK